MKFTVLDGSLILNSVNNAAARNQYFLSSVYFKYIFIIFLIVLFLLPLKIPVDIV